MANIDWQQAYLKKVSVCIDGHATSISLEPAFLTILKKAAKAQNISLTTLITTIDSMRPVAINLSAALRFYALRFMENEV